MTRIRSIAAVALLALLGAGCGAAFAVSGEQTAVPITGEDTELATDAAGDAGTTTDGASADGTADQDATDNASDQDAVETDDSANATADDGSGAATESDAKLGVLLSSDEALDGQVLFGPAEGSGLYLIENNGQVTSAWARAPGSSAPTVADDAELLPNGLILRTVNNSTVDAMGATGTVELIDKSGALAWSCDLREAWFGGQHFQGDAAWIAPDETRGTAPWGSIIMSAYLVQSGDKLGDIGKNLSASDRVYVDSLIEVVPNVSGDQLSDNGGAYRAGDCGRTVWEWRATDRIAFDAADLPVPGGVDWTVFTSVAYNADLDMVAAAASGIGEVWVIDHSTTTETSETDSIAAELLARWTDADRPISVSWAGSLLLVVADGAVWSVDVSDNSADRIYDLSGEQGYADQLPNDNLLITDADGGVVVEISTSGEVVWQFVSPVVPGGALGEPDEILDLDADVEAGANRIGQAHKYPAGYPGFD